MKIKKTVPVFKDYIWGGTKLKTEYGKSTELEIVAESWELSSHKDGMSSFVDEKFNLAELYQSNKSVFGKNIDKFQDFPILIKFINAKDNLSVQVHPSDDYAIKNENSFGKTEMWYVVDCEQNAGIYVGFVKDLTKDEFAEHIENLTLMDVLNFIPVKKGDCFFIEAGTVHAIGKGTTICEIQQNSNLTYRVYDFGRAGIDGKPRELHIDKAKTVSNLRKYEANNRWSCEYFDCKEIKIIGETKLSTDENSFACLTFVQGTGKINGEKFCQGDSFFVPASTMDISIEGNATCIMTKLGK